MKSRRFYKTVSVTGDLGIALDGRLVKTPGKVPLHLPLPALAQAVAAEWEAQGETIDPASMVMTRLANTAIDRVPAHRPAILAEMRDFAGSDLVCYRAAEPDDLVARQSAAWDPVIDGAVAELGQPIAIWSGVMHRPQPAATLEAVSRWCAKLSDFEIAAFHSLMTLTGSALIPMMLTKRAIAPDQAWAAAHVDEDFQIEAWGQDDEAAARRRRRHAEFDACCRFLLLAASN
ncbi:MAG: ATP12 family protein [Aestuariivirga sp.]